MTRLHPTSSYNWRRLWSPRWPEAGRDDIQVEFGRASLDTAQHKVFDGVVADRTQAQGVLHRAVKHLEIEGLQKPKDLDVFPLAGLAYARLQETAQGLGRHQAVPIRLAARPDPGHRSCAPAKAGSGSDRRPYLPGRRNGGVGQ